MATVKAIIVCGGVYFVVGAACAAGYLIGWKLTEKVVGPMFD